ncbi:MAG: aliphatic sulfonate ABC transporter substrate-binding protein [Prevotella sp.]|jgi:sulfonate transport system substrate-binding protein|nr:aliphatic sulfonate ABC transporter substrate-binding protein [Prevotella sp.]
MILYMMVSIYCAKGMCRALVGGLLCASMFLSACGEAQKEDKRTDKPQVIRLAYQLGHLPDIIALHKRFVEDEFAKDSIKIVFKKFDYGPPEVEAFNAGELDFGSIGDQPAIIGWARGVEFKIVGNITGSEDKMALLVPKDSPVKSFSELKEKKIAITVGSNIQHLFNLYLQQNGWKQSDVNLVNLQFTDCIIALSANEIDATILSDPYISIATYKYGAKVISYSNGLKYTTLPYIASNEFIAEYPDIVIRLLKTYRKAAEWARNSHEEAANILLKEENNLLPREIDIELIDKYTENFGLDDNAIKAFGETYKYLKETNIIRNNPDITTLYERRFDEAAQKLLNDE